MAFFTTHHHHHYGLQEQEVRSMLAALRSDLVKRLDTIMIDQSALKSAVARLVAADTAMLATLQGVRDDNKTLAASLADVKAKLEAMPQDTTELEGTITDAIDTLNTNAQAIEDQVKANTKVPDMAAPPA